LHAVVRGTFWDSLCNDRRKASDIDTRYGRHNGARIYINNMPPIAKAIPRVTTARRATTVNRKVRPAKAKREQAKTISMLLYYG